MRLQMRYRNSHTNHQSVDFHDNNAPADPNLDKSSNDEMDKFSPD